MYAGFEIYMLMGIEICDLLYTVIKPSYSRVFKLANVCNDGYCHISLYMIYKTIFSRTHFLMSSSFSEGQALPC